MGSSMENANINANTNGIDRRRKTRSVKVGALIIGGENGSFPVQSMLSLPSSDVSGNIEQAKRLEQAGCEILRLAIPDKNAIPLIYELKNKVSMPLVADIHFDYRLALEAVAAGIDKIRINPGNIGDDNRVKAVADSCRQKGVPIRIGVNSGSIEKSILARHGAPTPAAMVESALYHAALLEKFDFSDIVISLKSSEVPIMTAAYRLLAEACSYPLHLGVTHAGSLTTGRIKNAIGIGSLLLDGIGDTIRVSLTADPVEEIYAGYDILAAVELRRNGVEIISCPACGRAKLDLISLASSVELALAGCKKPIKVAVMGCAVNGPGEAREADIGIACGDGCGLIFAKGEIIKKVSQSEIIKELLLQIELM